MAGRASKTMDYGTPPWEQEETRVAPARVRRPVSAEEITSGYSPPPPKRKLTARKKRGPKKKHLTVAERELRLMSPRMRDLAEGRLRVEDLDWEELTRGQLRDVNGGFSGIKPAILPRSWHDAIAREITKGAEAQFRQNYDLTMEVLIGLIKDPRTPAREKLAAVINERKAGRLIAREA